MTTAGSQELPPYSYKHLCTDEGTVLTLQPRQCTSGLGPIPEQEHRAGDRSYTREMQQKVVEGVIVKVRYFWVRICSCGGA